MKRVIGAFAASMLLAVSVMTVSAAAPVTEIRSSETVTVAEGVRLEKITSLVDDRKENFCVLTAPGGAYMFEIGGKVSEKSLVTEAEPLTSDKGEQVVAAINGDHFSFATGIPLGMSISDGRMLTSPIEPYNADDYYFHALGITADGDVLTGENPTMRAVCTIDGQELTVDRVNRTRENWEGGQVCLFTPDYGESTGTDVMGVEAVIRVTDGYVGTGSTLTGVIERVSDGNDTVIEDGTVVLSVHLLRDETAWLKEGAAVSFSVSFEQEEWNDVRFAVGGNRTIVENGEPISFDYTVGAFASCQPRSALGVRTDGTLVMVTVDGRSEASEGLTANKMAEFMAISYDCSHAILLDGGGSTAMAVADAAGVLQTANVPSEERPVGNTVWLVKQNVTVAPQDIPYSDSSTVLLWVAAAVLAVMVACVAVRTIKKRKNHGEND